MKKLTDKVALITGASRGLGLAVARQYWNEGASLLLVARNGDALAEIKNSLTPEGGQRCEIMTADLADPGAPAAIADRVESDFGRIDVLVNNAAIQGPIGCIWDNDWQEWLTTQQVNLLAPVELCKRVIPLMIRNKFGKIINLAGGGATGPRQRVTAYATAKAALVRFSETIADETAEYGIDVNCISPGAMVSAQTQEILDKGEEAAGKKEYGAIQKLFTTGGVDPEIPARLCLYLASEESNGVTGKIISAVWDDWATLHEHLDELKSSDVFTIRRIIPKERGMSWGEVES